MDRTTGQMSDTRTRFLGTKPPKLFVANVKGQRAMLALSKRPWLGYSDMGRYNLTPLSYETLDFASGGLRCTYRRPLHHLVCRQTPYKQEDYSLEVLYYQMLVRAGSPCTTRNADYSYRRQVPALLECRTAAPCLHCCCIGPGFKGAL